MKIKQLSIQSYGPLADKKYQFHDGFNLVFGRNEQGKSLTLDALTKLLLGKSSKKFAAINRVEDDPAAYGSFVSVTTIKDNQPESVKLQGKSTLTDLIGLTADECQNLFLIRNSNLSIGQDLSDQDRFYTSLTDRLTGLKTQEIQQVSQQLRDAVQITDKTAQFQNTSENFKLGERLQKAELLLSAEGKITQLMQQDETEHWSDLEAQAVELKQKLSEYKQQLGQLESAKQIQESRAIWQKIQQLEKLHEQLAPLANISQSQLDEFRLAEQNLINLQEKKDELKQEIKNKNQKLIALEKELEKINRQIKQNNEAQQELENRIQPDLVLLAKKYATYNSYPTKPWWQIGLYLGSSLLSLSVIAYLIKPVAIFLALVIIFCLATIVSFLKFILHNQQHQQLDRQLEQLKLDSVKYGIKGKKIEDILQQTQTFKQEFQALTQQQASLKAQTQQLKQDIVELDDKKISLIQEQLQRSQQQVAQIKTSHQLKTLADYEAKLNQKNSLTIQWQKLATLVTEKLGTAPENQDDLDFWQEKIAQAQTLTEADQTIQYSPTLVTQLISAKDQAEIKLEQLKHSLSFIKTELRDLEKELNQVLKDRSEPILCENMNDLKQAVTELKALIEFHFNKRQQTLDIIKILDTIAEQEKEKVGELFGPKSAISQHFNKITNGRYDLVTFDQTTSQIQVRLTLEKTILTADKLSAGTYDQLYLAIRLGLGKQLLNQQTGFFILDDPFLKSDQKRLEDQLQMLLELAKQGWQIIYFSAKNEVKDYVQDLADNVITVKN